MTEVVTIIAQGIGWLIVYAILMSVLGDLYPKLYRRLFIPPRYILPGEKTGE